MPDPGQEEPLERMEKIVHAMLSHKDSEPFREPVDWRGLGLLDYLDHVEKPMDLGTIKRRLERGQYKTAHECAEDCRLVWANCQAYNVSNSKDIVSDLLCKYLYHDLDLLNWTFKLQLSLVFLTGRRK
jgi:hypothetical protein